MIGLADKYRPRDWPEVIGQDAIVKRLKLIESRGGFGGNALWFSGKSGAGKTSLALLCAAKHGADADYIETLPGRKLTPTILREWHEVSHWTPQRAFVVNEAHGLSVPVIEELLDVLESGAIPQSALWLFTTTIAGQEFLFEQKMDARPLLSRCKEFALNEQPGTKQLATRLLEIARAENLDGKPLQTYERLVTKHNQNWRACLNAIESGEMLS